MAETLLSPGVLTRENDQSQITQGPIVAAGDPCPVPGQVTAGTTLVGLIKVTTSSSATFTPGSTDLGAAGITDVFSDCMDMPGSAQ